MIGSRRHRFHVGTNHRRRASDYCSIQGGVQGCAMCQKPIKRSHCRGARSLFLLSSILIPPLCRETNKRKRAGHRWDACSSYSCPPILLGRRSLVVVCCTGRCLANLLPGSLNAFSSGPSYAFKVCSQTTPS